MQRLINLNKPNFVNTAFRMNLYSILLKVVAIEFFIYFLYVHFINIYIYINMKIYCRLLCNLVSLVSQCQNNLKLFNSVYLFNLNSCEKLKVQRIFGYDWIHCTIIFYIHYFLTNMYIYSPTSSM